LQLTARDIMPTTYFLIALLISIALHFGIPIEELVPQPWNLVGLIPLGFGVWLNVSADRAFRQAKTTVKPFEESSVLLTSGAFRFTRNPMYLGFVAILLGESILLRSLSPYVVVIGFAVLMDRTYIKVEERMLAEKFGEEWQRYASKVRRWL
jgi:protein-S-isoprenylcysteine O-methyltransferase Ste14